MKKVLSVILAAVMLACVMPFAVFADNPEVTLSGGEFTDPLQLVSGTDYVIPSGVTMTVPADMELRIPTNTTLRVKKGGKLDMMRKAR